MRSRYCLMLALLACQPLLGQVPYDRILDADQQQSNWLTYSGLVSWKLLNSRCEMA